MSIEGRIAVDVSFADKADGTGVQSLKKIQLADTQAYTSGKVAIVSGTCGTAAVQVWGGLVGSVDYTNSAGEAVTMSSVQRVAFQASPSAVVRGTGSWGTLDLTSNSDESAVSGRPFYATPQVGGSLTVQTVTGTASYTVVLYGT